MIIAYITATAFLACVFFYAVEGWFKTKLLVTFAMFFMATSLYFSLDSFSGWPSAGEPEGESRVYAIVIQEPSGDLEGHIYVWAAASPVTPVPLVPWYQAPPGAPRSYSVPYTEQSAADAAAAQKALKEGKVVKYASKNGVGKRGAEGDKDGTGTSTGPSYQNDEDSDYVILNPTDAPPK